MKKGISPLIASVLLIVLAVTSVLTLSIWSARKTEELTKGAGSEVAHFQKGFSVDLEVLDVVALGIGETSGSDFCYDVTVQNNGKQEVGYEIIGKDSDGNSVECNYPSGIIVEFEVYTVQVCCDTSVDSILVIPLIDNKLVMNKEIEANVPEPDEEPPDDDDDGLGETRKESVPPITPYG